MNLTEIQDLIKFVAKSGVSEVEIEQKDFKICIKSEVKGKPEHQVIVQAAPVAAAVSRAPDPGWRGVLPVRRSFSCCCQTCLCYLQVPAAAQTRRNGVTTGHRPARKRPIGEYYRLAAGLTMAFRTAWRTDFRMPPRQRFGFAMAGGGKCLLSLPLVTGTNSARQEHRNGAPGVPC